jgi:plastocyanin
MKPATRSTLLASLLTFALAIVPYAMGGGGHDEQPEAMPVEGEVGHVEPAEEADPGVRSPDLAPGDSWSHTFTETGKFDYHCHPHPWMLAGIEVDASSGRAPMNYTIEIVEPVGEVFGNWTFAPAVTRVEVGDTVTWVNKGSTVHVIQQTVGEHIEHIGTAAGGGGGGGDDHGAEGVAGDIRTSSGAIMGLPAQGWMWVGFAMVGGVLVGRRITTVKAPRGALAAAKGAKAPEASSEPSSHPVTVSVEKGSGSEPRAVSSGPLLVHEPRHHKKDRRRERRERRRNRM